MVGASGGIGAALVRALEQRGHHQRVFRGQRRIDLADESLLAINVDEEDSVRRAAATLGERLARDALVLRGLYICSGVLHAADLRPERRLADLAPEAFLRVMRTNALGPLLVARHFLPLVPREGASRISAISARVGSIGDNRKGGWHSYRASKAALNMGFRNLAIELARTHPACVVTLFHPGTVATALSQPFQGMVPADQLFDPERAARQYCDVLDRRDNGQAPMFVDWAGEGIEF